MLSFILSIKVRHTIYNKYFIGVIYHGGLIFIQTNIDLIFLVLTCSSHIEPGENLHASCLQLNEWDSCNSKQLFADTKSETPNSGPSHFEVN